MVINCNVAANTKSWLSLLAVVLFAHGIWRPLPSLLTLLVAAAGTCPARTFLTDRIGFFTDGPSKWEELKRSNHLTYYRPISASYLALILFLLVLVEIFLFFKDSCHPRNNWRTQLCGWHWLWVLPWRSWRSYHVVCWRPWNRMRVGQSLIIQCSYPQMGPSLHPRWTFGLLARGKHPS